MGIFRSWVLRKTSPLSRKPGLASFRLSSDIPAFNPTHLVCMPWATGFMMTSFSLSGLSKKNDQPIFAAFGWGHLVAKQGEHPGNDLANDGAFIDDQNFLRGLLFSISLSKSRNIPLDYSIPFFVCRLFLCSKRVSFINGLRVHQA
jgi:hypothetical protein